MNSEEVKLASQDILEKEFKTVMRGYSQDEVDEFLDIIIKDYESFQQQIDQLQRENDQLKKKPEKRTTRATQATQIKAHTNPTQTANYDVLKRLSNLEKAVFGNNSSFSTVKDD